MPGDFAVRVEGLQTLRKALRDVDRDVLKEVQQVSKRAAEIVAVEARVRAPKRTGRLAGSVKSTTSGAKGVVHVAQPYANVIEWGGTTGRGHSRGHAGATHIRPHHFVTGALEANQRRVQQEFAAGLSDVLRRHNF